MKKDKYFQEIIRTLQELNDEFPHEAMPIHLGLASEGYNHIEDVPSNKELAYILKKYQAAKQLDHQVPFTNIEEDYGDYEEE